MAAFRQEEKYAGRYISLRFRTHCDSDSDVISPQAHSDVGRRIAQILGEAREASFVFRRCSVLVSAYFNCVTSVTMSHQF